MAVEGKRAVLVIAHQRYREEELDVPRRVLEKAGVRVRVASSSLGLATGMQAGRCAPDLLYSALRADDLDALIFVGGLGATEYFEDRAAHRLVREALRAGKVVGAICFGSSILANAGVLEGVPATCFPSREAHLREQGAITTGEPVTCSGTIVTARGPEDARAFAEALLASLT